MGQKPRSLALWRQGFLDSLDDWIDETWREVYEGYNAPRKTAEFSQVGSMFIVEPWRNQCECWELKVTHLKMFAPQTLIHTKQNSALRDLVERLVDQRQLNQLWRSDITYLRTAES